MLSLILYTKAVCALLENDTWGFLNKNTERFQIFNNINKKRSIMQW